MTRKVYWLIGATLLLTLLFRSNGSPQTPLIAIDPWVDISVPVVVNDMVIIGFHVKNRGTEPIELLEGRFKASTSSIALKEVWVSETIGCLSGSLDEISEQWNEGSKPTNMHGYLLDSAQTVGVAYVFSVPEEGNHSITMLGIAYRSDLSSRVHEWSLNDFNKLVMDVKPRLLEQ